MPRPSNPKVPGNPIALLQFGKGLKGLVFFGGGLGFRALGLGFRVYRGLGLYIVLPVIAPQSETFKQGFGFSGPVLRKNADSRSPKQYTTHPLSLSLYIYMYIMYIYIYMYE